LTSASIVYYAQLLNTTAAHLCEDDEEEGNDDVPVVHIAFKNKGRQQDCSFGEGEQQGYGQGYCW